MPSAHCDKLLPIRIVADRFAKSVQRRKLQAGLWLLVIAAVGAGACSSSDRQPETTPTLTKPLSDNAFPIIQRDFMFEPSNISVAANTKFEMDVRNQGSVAHTYTITDANP